MKKYVPKEDKEAILKEASARVKKSKIKILPGQIYNIYECGCVVALTDDPPNYRFHAMINQTIKACPICDFRSDKIPYRLYTKYKRCICGFEQVSKKMNASHYCKHEKGSKVPIILEQASKLSNIPELSLAIGLRFVNGKLKRFTQPLPKY